MLRILLRALSAVFAVLVAIVVTLNWGSSSFAQFLTVTITAGVVALCEWLAIWAPKRWTRARRWLDPRSVFAGVWLQHDVHSFGEQGGEGASNRFALFLVRYAGRDDSYLVDGVAYGDDGAEFAAWHSSEALHFTGDGWSMTYLWEGTIRDPKAKAHDPERSGFARLKLMTEDSGRGRVEHVSADVNLEFKFSRLTAEWLRRSGLKDVTIEDLADPQTWGRFGRAFAGVGRAKTGGS